MFASYFTVVLDVVLVCCEASCKLCWKLNLFQAEAVEVEVKGTQSFKFKKSERGTREVKGNSLIFSGFILLLIV